MPTNKRFSFSELKRRAGKNPKPLLKLTGGLLEQLAASVRPSDTSSHSKLKIARNATRALQEIASFTLVVCVFPELLEGVTERIAFMLITKPERKALDAVTTGSVRVITNQTVRDTPSILFLSDGDRYIDDIDNVYSDTVVCKFVDTLST